MYEFGTKGFAACSGGFANAWKENDVCLNDALLRIVKARSKTSNELVKTQSEMFKVSC
jgi:hypothetical protein